MHEPLRQVCGICSADPATPYRREGLEHTPGTILSKANYRNQIKTAGLLDVPLRHHLPALIA